ncbi:MAG: hypothetical protein HY535_07555 [Chloroflexi bacterium]|nr:hypothetical protein [Chloroflexota bacterium]
MADLVLSFSIAPYDRVMPLITGEVKPVGITLQYQPVAGPDLFYRQLKFNQFDLSEMSHSFFLMGRSRGWGYRLLPVFHNRKFYYTRILIRRGSGIQVDHPESLKGKRVGNADYCQSAALWTRGILQHEFGVKPEDMEWYQDRPERFSVASSMGFKPPANVKFHYTTTDLGTMFLRGELDAAITYQTGAIMDRPKADISKDRRFTTMFRDAKREASRFFKKTGVFPPQHVTVIRESILKEHPWVANNLMEAFEKAKKLAYQRLYDDPPTCLVFGVEDIRQQRETFGDDPFKYGIKANRTAIDMAQTFSAEQGLTPRKQPWSEVFPEELLLAEESLPD